MRPSVEPPILALCLAGSSLLLGNKACDEGSHFDILGPEEDAGRELWVDDADGGPRAAGARAEPAAGGPGVGAGAAAGRSADRPFAPSGRTCGGSASLTCEADEFCDYEPVAGGRGCDGTTSDAAGVCARQPTACTRDYLPVCSCDRRTYGNRCLANGDAVSVLHEGACTELDCEAIGGRAAYGAGPGPMCNPGEEAFTTIVNSDGSIPIEGALCCVAH